MLDTEIKSLKSLNHYLRKLVENRLWLKVIIALFLGVGVGLLLSPQNGWITKGTADVLGNWLALPGMLFLKLVQMIMIPLIVASIITGIASNDKENLKKLGGGVLLYFISTTIISVTIGTVLALIFRPGNYLHQQAEVDHTNALADAAKSSELSFGINDIPNAITNLLPENPLASMVSGEMLSIVIFTIIIGVAVFGLMAQLTSSVGLNSLTSLGFYVLVVLMGLLILLGIYMMLVSILGQSNPFKFLRKITDVQLLAFSTTSSAAVMPLSLKTAEEELKVDASISNFIIPIGTTVNMDGTALYQTITTLFIAQAYGLEMGLLNVIVVVVTIVAASIGTPAIPGGGVVILASVLSSAGIPAEGIIIIIGVERLLGMFRSAINVTGDLTACMIFDRFYGNKPGGTKESDVKTTTEYSTV